MLVIESSGAAVGKKIKIIAGIYADKDAYILDVKNHIALVGHVQRDYLVQMAVGDHGNFQITVLHEKEFEFV